MPELFEPWVTKATLVVSLLAGANVWLYAMSVKLHRQYVEEVWPARRASGSRVPPTRNAAIAREEVARSRAVA